MTMVLLKRLERAARSRRDLPGRSRRGRHRRASASSSWPISISRDRGGVLPRRRRRRQPVGGQVKFASVQTLEKMPRAIELVARVASPVMARCRCRTNADRAPRRRAVAARRRHGSRRCASTTRRARISSGSPVSRRRRMRGATWTSSSSDPKWSTARRRVFPRARAAPRVDAAHVDLPEHLSGRLPHQRDPLRSPRHARRAHAAGRGSRAVARGSAQVVNDPAVEVAWGQRDVRPAPAARELDSEAFTAIEAGDREALRHRHAADDEHRGDRHGVPAREGHPVLRGRPRAPTSRTGRRASVRTATRSGSSKASCTASCSSITTWCSRWR